MRGRRSLLAAASVAVAVAASTLATRDLLSRWGEFRLPRDIPIDDLIADLSSILDPAAVAQQADGNPVRLGSVQPGYELKASAGPRQAIVAPAGSVLRHRLELPQDSALVFSVGVEGDGKRDRRAAGIRFVVAVDGEPRFTRVVNPARDRRERVWFDGRVALPARPGRPVEITLATEAGGSGRLAGTPGWSGVRVVQRRWRARQPASPTAPNVLVLLVDTLRADRLGCYGASPSPSPTLDRLADAGLFFESAVAQAPWTMPSVASVLTGLHPRSHGVGRRTLDQIARHDEGDDSVLPDSLTTLAEAAQAAGITTLGISANPVVSRATNFAQGFETFLEFGLERRDGENNWASAADLNALLLRWLARNRDHRFLAYVQYMDPHHPYTPPARLRPVPPPGVRPPVASGHLEQWGDRILSAAGMPLSDEEAAYLRRLYDAEIRGWDEELARLLDALGRLRVLDSTVVVVTADHGEEFQEHGRLQHGAHLFDEQVRVPLVIVGPGVGRGRVTQQAQGIDLFPTVAALLGCATPPGLPGHDLRAPHPIEPAISETTRGRLPDGTAVELLAARTPEWKLVWAPAVGRYAIYDLVHDPAERDDRFGAAPDGAALANLLARWRATAPPAPVGEIRDLDIRERLRALGYVQ